MIGTVTKISDFKKNNGWLFVLIDANGEEYFIMGDTFYKNKKLKSPITKNELDNLLIGFSLKFNFSVIDNKNVITKLLY